MTLADDERQEQELREEMRERIRDGMAVLDRIRPDWMTHIDPLLLDLGETDCCIVGQLRAATDYEFDFLANDVPPEAVGKQFPSALGMDLTDRQFNSLFSARHLYSMLTEEWIAAINARR